MDFLLRGISLGFRIGFNRSCRLKPPLGNFRSVDLNRATVDEYIAEEVTSGRLVQRPQSAPPMRCSPIGMIPKAHQPGKFRLIVDLSAPPDFSVNDGISTALCSLRYVTVDRAARLVKDYGQGALMAKIDLQSAYRHIPVHPEDQHLLGIEWDGKEYRDQALPFGLRSAPKLFTAVADGLAWAMQQEGVHNSVHYLDDFLFWGPPSSPECGVSLSKATAVCHPLGLPTAPHKTVGPATVLTFLGIEVDSMAQVLRLPAAKLVRLQRELARWESKRQASKRELQRMIGLLSYAATVVRPGRSFLRYLIEASKRPRRQPHKTRIDAGCRSDLAWWSLFAQDWNGVALFHGLPAGETVVSDASGSWGCGAYCSATKEWFQLRWPPSWAEVNIAAKELVPVVVSAAVWGSKWSGCRVLFRSDNQAVVDCLTSMKAGEDHLAHLLRCLFFIEARFKFEHHARHISGCLNTAADALSRDKVTEFFSIFSQAPPRVPQRIPDALTELLWDKDTNWTSVRWKDLFGSITRTESQRRQ